MKNIFIILFIAMLTFVSPAIADETKSPIDLSTIGFHKRSELPVEQQIKLIFQNYEKYTNNHNLEAFLNLYDNSYLSTDGYDKNRLKDIAIEAWKEYPNTKFSIKILSIHVNLDNATVITSEKLAGFTNVSVDYIKGNGYIDSESTSVYYLKNCSNGWKIISDFVISEKTSMKYGAAKFIPMQLDAPAIVSPNEQYTSIIKMDVPKNYVALVSLNNEPITFPIEKSTEVFRGIKAEGTRERILTSNNGSKNENAIASIGIAKPTINDEDININLVGIAFLSSRVNVIKHKIDYPKPNQEDINKECLEDK